MCLYPSEAKFLKAVLERGIWKYLKENYFDKQIDIIFSKPFVKVCLYASFFQGGKKVFKQKILKLMREELALTKDEFEDRLDYENFVNKDHHFSDFMSKIDLLDLIKKSSD
jgi:hypothetical protein